LKGGEADSLATKIQTIRLLVVIIYLSLHSDCKAFYVENIPVFIIRLCCSFDGGPVYTEPASPALVTAYTSGIFDATDKLCL